MAIFKVYTEVVTKSLIILTLSVVFCGSSMGQVPSGQLLPGSRVLIDDTTVYHDANIPKPGYLQSFIDPIFRTKITRITGDPGTNQGGVTVWGTDARHHYSLDQAWNADMSMLIISNKEGGSPSPIVLNGETYQFLRGLPISGYYDYRWHPTDPKVIISISGNKIKRYNFDTNTDVVLHTFSEYSSIDWCSKGKLSWDGKRTAFRSSDSLNYYAYVYDIETDTKGAVLTMAKDTPEPKPYISASGKYVIVYRSDTDTRVYDANMTYIMELPYNISHYDYALDANGDDVIVGTYKPSGGGVVITQRLRDGHMTTIAPGYSSHTSCTNIRRPGWAYITYMTDWSSYPSYQPYYMEIVVAKMDGSGEVHRLSHIRHVDSDSDYETEAHASASPDGKRVIFASTWNEADGRPVQAYVIDLRDLRPYKEYTDFTDLSIFADWWLNSCTTPSWCEGCDTDQDTNVNLLDFTVFADYWNP